MSQNTKAAQNSNRTRVAEICERLRADLESAHPRTEYERNRHHVMLSVLDIAQHKGRAALFLDVRSMAYAAGVDKNTASAILTYLSTVESTEGGTRLIKLWRKHPRHANVFVINPAYPHVYRFIPPRGRAGVGQ